MENTVRRGWLLCTMCLGVLLGTFGFTNLHSTMDSLQKTLNIPLGTSYWVLTGYDLSVALIMITVGRLSDIFGYRRFFIGGFIFYTLVLLTEFGITDGRQSITIQIVEGFAIALFFPTIYTLILHNFPERQHGTASAAGIASAILSIIFHPIITELSTYISHISLYFSIVLSIITIVLGYLVIPVDFRQSRPRASSVGAALISTCFVIFVGGLYLINLTGLIDIGSIKVLTWFLMIFIALGGFLVFENVMLRTNFDFTILKNPRFFYGSIYRSVTMFIFSGVVLMFILLFDNFYEYTIFESAPYFLALSVPALGAAIYTGVMINKKSPSRCMFVSLIPTILGIILIYIFNLTDLPDPSIIAPTCSLTLGLGIAWVSSNLITLKALPRSCTGLASGIMFSIILIGNTASIWFINLLIYYLGTSNAILSLSSVNVPLDSSQIQALNNFFIYGDMDYITNNFPTENLLLVKETVVRAYELVINVAFLVMVLLALISTGLFYFFNRNIREEEKKIWT